MTGRFVAGLVGAPFGLKGFVKVRSLSGEIDHLLKLRSVVLRQNGAEKTAVIEESSPALLPQALMKFAGIDSPEDAKALGGAELLVRREEASPLGPGEFYIEDLKGLAVVFVGGLGVGGFGGGSGAGASPGVEPGAEGSDDGQTGEILGHVAGIVEGGGGDLVEIRLSTGESKLVPLRKEFFAPLVPETGRIVLLERWILE
jgi:16S rRNA processing protein RimM